MAFAFHNDEILSLEEFESESSELFSDCDSLSSHDFVARWKILQDGKTASGNTSFLSDLDLPGPSHLLPTMSSTPVKDNTSGKKKRKTLSNVTGRQRGILAWERDENKGLFSADIAFGGEGWPPPFRPLVQEMRDFLHSETGLKGDWNSEDASMLRKYYYLKFKIPVRSASFVILRIYSSILHFLNLIAF